MTPARPLFHALAGAVEVNSKLESNNNGSLSFGYGYTIYERTCTYTHTLGVMQHMGRHWAAAAHIRIAFSSCNINIANGLARRTVDGGSDEKAGRNVFKTACAN